MAEGGNADSVPEAVSLGRGVDDVQLLVLRRNGELAGIGEMGEIHIRSPHLARGYRNDRELTESRFINNYFTSESGDRLYRTGDLGRYLTDGRVTFAGRVDFQIKVRGYRIEPGEIEHVLAEHDLVSEARVMLRGKAEQFLTAYIQYDDHQPETL